MPCRTFPQQLATTACILFRETPAATISGYLLHLFYRYQVRAFCLVITMWAPRSPMLYRRWGCFPLMTLFAAPQKLRAGMLILVRETSSSTTNGDLLQFFEDSLALPLFCALRTPRSLPNVSWEGLPLMTLFTLPEEFYVSMAVALRQASPSVSGSNLLQLVDHSLSFSPLHLRWPGPSGHGYFPRTKSPVARRSSTTLFTACIVSGLSA